MAPGIGTSRGDRPGDESYYLRTRKRLEHAYLGAEDARGGSGFRGDAGRWERARRPITSAIDRDGTFLDIGCANGLLMESLVGWCGENGLRIEPYGLDLIPSLAALARRRLPRWSDRIFVGNVVDWVSPLRFDFARAELAYAPRDRHREMIERLLSMFLVPSGRLILCSYGSPLQEADPVGETLRGWGYHVAGESEGIDAGGPVITRVAWTDAQRTFSNL